MPSWLAASLKLSCLLLQARPGDSASADSSRAKSPCTLRSALLLPLSPPKFVPGGPRGPGDRPETGLLTPFRTLRCDPEKHPDENVRYRLQASSLGACYNRTWELRGVEGFRPPFVSAWRGLSSSGALGSCVQQAPLDRFRVLPFFDSKVGKIERTDPVKGS